MRKAFLLLISFINSCGLLTLCYANLISIGTGNYRDLYLPVHSKAVYSYSQQIYYQNEINYKGKITKLSFRHYSGDFENTNHWCIYGSYGKNRIQRY